MKRFDLVGNKLDCNIDIPEEFCFKPAYMNDELARKEKEGWIERRQLDEVEVSFKRMKRWADYNYEPEEYKQHSYQLCSMIVHHGESSLSGHYFSVVRVPNGTTDTWVKFNDDKITFVDSTLK